MRPLSDSLRHKGTRMLVLAYLCFAISAAWLTFVVVRLRHFCIEQRKSLEGARL